MSVGATDDEMRMLKLSVFLLLAILHLIALGFGLLIYTSMFKWAPWFEPCGMQIFAIFTCIVPVLCLLGVLVVLLGLILPLSIPTRLAAFLGAGILSLPLGLADGFGGTLWHISEDACFMLGVILNVALVLWVFGLTTRDVKRILRGAMTAPTKECMRRGKPRA